MPTVCRLIVLVMLLLIAAVPHARAQVLADHPAVPTVDANPSITSAIKIPSPTDNIIIPTDPRLVSVLTATLDLLEKLPPKTRKALLDEAERSRNYCKENNLLSNFYDCSCFSLRMLGARIEKGPNVPMINMIPDLDLGMCVAAPTVAGYGLTRCTQTEASSRLSADQIKSLCECTARRLTTGWTKSPKPSIRYIDNIFLSALGDCHAEMHY